MPPIAGLHDIFPISLKELVIKQLFLFRRAHAKAASTPACPPPIIIISNLSTLLLNIIKLIYILFILLLLLLRTLFSVNYFSTSSTNWYRENMKV